MKTKIILALALLAISTGCANRQNLKSPPPAHVVNTLGAVKQLGIGINQTGTGTLGYQAGLVHVTTIPVQLVTDTNGAARYVAPDVVITYEIKASTGTFGSAASTYTFATGKSGVQTWAGGQHLPINILTNFPVPPAIETNAP